MQNKKDTIFIKDLTINTLIGILDVERINKQRVSISVELTIPNHNAAVTDNINNCPVNYAAVHEHIIEFASKNHFGLVETFAESLAQKLLKNFNCLSIELSVAKLDIFTDTAAVGIKIYREQNAV